MKTDKLEKNILTAKEALRSFLTTLLGNEAPLHVEDPVRADFDEAKAAGDGHITFTAGSSKDDQWAVILDANWLPLLSKSMLGEPIEFGQPGADDLLQELAAQAYGAVRTQLSSAGVTMADAEIALLSSSEGLEQERFASTLYKVAFEIKVDDQVLTGLAIVPVSSDDASAKSGNVRKSDPSETGTDPQSSVGIEGTAVPAASTDAEASAGPAFPDAEAIADTQAAAHDQAFADAERFDIRLGRESEDDGSVVIAPAAFPSLGHEVIGGDGSDSGFELLAEVELEVTVELGRRKIPLADVLRLTTGSVIELEKLVGEPLEVYANGRLIAEGEAVVMDEQFGVRITSLASNRHRAKAFV